MYNYFGVSSGFAILCFLLFGLLRWLQIPTGNLVDWLIGIASFWWLMVIVTVPWNIYFDAKEVIAEANLSKEKKIPVDEKQLKYAIRVSRGSILVAIALHLLSGIGLYLLAATGISVVGYVSSGATLLLTILRPTIRAYQYLARRLRMIREQIKYPREDVLELRGRFEQLTQEVKFLSAQLDPEKEDSFVTTQQEAWQNVRQDLARLRATFDQAQANNEIEHEKLSREAKSAIAQLTEDGQFLDHVREIIRFFKTA
jgi:hypothetical protein